MITIIIKLTEILLYLQLVSPTGSYTADGINAIVTGNQPAVQNVQMMEQNNPNFQAQLDQQYSTVAQGIVHFDPDENY